MKVISIWNPWASLVAHGHKRFETRGWSAPASMIGQRIGIASTRVIRPEQRLSYTDSDFEKFYAETELPAFERLPHGFLLGSARLVACHKIDAELIEQVSNREYAFGWWQIGNYAWEFAEARALSKPISVSGGQKLWNWTKPTIPRIGNVIPLRAA